MLILFILDLIVFGTGLYIQFFQDKVTLGNKFIGFGVLVGVFVVMPVFLYVRLRKKKLKDYTLTPENIKKMRDKHQD